jgi:SAM-dependent methyltransferase
MVEEFVGLDDYKDLMHDVINFESDQAEFLGETFYETYHPKSVIDIGCGPGIYLLPFMRHGCEVLGIDAETSMYEKYIPNNFQRVDLRLPWTPPHKFDLALCIEVAEHLKCEFSETIVHTCAQCADRIFFTAAIPGQGGTNHYCCRPTEEWIEMFARDGFFVAPETKQLQQVLIKMHRVNRVCEWLTRGLIFERN